METTGQNATKLTLYIAGPMRGYPENNHPAFLRAEKKLETRKIYKTIINPAKIDQLRDNEIDIYNLSKEDMNQILTEDFILLMSCDSIYMLRGWENSPGARAEHAIATAFKMYIEYEN